jgi:hypothetical protein
MQHVVHCNTQVHGPGCYSNAGLLPALSSVADAQDKTVACRPPSCCLCARPPGSQARQAAGQPHLATYTPYLESFVSPPNITPRIHVHGTHAYIPLYDPNEERQSRRAASSEAGRQAGCGMHQHQQRLSQKAGAHAACQRNAQLHAVARSSRPVTNSRCVRLFPKQHASRSAASCSKQRPRAGPVHMHALSLPQTSAYHRNKRVPLMPPLNSSSHAYSWETYSQMHAGVKTSLAQQTHLVHMTVHSQPRTPVGTCTPTQHTGALDTQRQMHAPVPRCIASPAHMAWQASECSTETPPSHAPLSGPYMYTCRPVQTCGGQKGLCKNGTFTFKQAQTATDKRNCTVCTQANRSGKRHFEPQQRQTHPCCAHPAAAQLPAETLLG